MKQFVRDFIYLFVDDQETISDPGVYFTMLLFTMAIMVAWFNVWR